MFRKWFLMEVELDQVKASALSLFGTASDSKNKLGEVAYSLVGWLGIYSVCVFLYVSDYLARMLGEMQASGDCDATPAGCGLAMWIGIGIGFVIGAIVWGLILSGILAIWLTARRFGVKLGIFYVIFALTLGTALYLTGYQRDLSQTLLIGIFAAVYLWVWRRSYKFVVRFISLI